MNCLLLQLLGADVTGNERAASEVAVLMEIF